VGVWWVDWLRLLGEAEAGRCENRGLLGLRVVVVVVVVVMGGLDLDSWTVM
jgi:hypothetical protein